MARADTPTPRSQTARSSHAKRLLPSWYSIESQFGTIEDMSTQIAVRLPDDLVEFVDDLVRHGDAPSRAAVVTRALRRERRQAAAARDAEILARTGSDVGSNADLDGLAEYVAATPLDDLD
jgi:Arc/MetJ-type ribon-helix-helix transcriptional regulator